MIINGIDLSRYKLKLKDDYVISPAIPKYKRISIPGANGVIDLTSIRNGVVPFENRVITTELIYVGDKKDWHQVYSDISNQFAGQMCKITFPLDPDYYWEGMCEVDNYTTTRLSFVIVITANVYPFKFTNKSTGESIRWNDINFEKSGWLGFLSNMNVDGELSFTVPVNAIDFSPTITSSSNMKLHFNNNVHDIKKGTHKYYEIILNRSENYFKLVGKGTVTFDVKRGRL